MPRNVTPVAAVTDSDLVSVPVSTAPGAADPMVFHNGPVMGTANVVILWAGTPAVDRAKFEAFAKDFLEGGALDALAYAGCTGGKLIASVDMPAIPGIPTTSDQIIAAVEAFVAQNPSLRQPDDHTLYTVMLPSGQAAQYTGDGSRSCVQWCGIHLGDESKHVIYSIQPATNCQGCNQGDAFAGQTMTWGHEVVEAASDPYGTGWYSDGPHEAGSENADEYAWQPMSYGPWTVQGWADDHGARVLGAYRGVQPQPQPQPQPGPPPGPPPKPAACTAADTYQPFSAFILGILPQLYPGDAANQQRLAGWDAWVRGLLVTLAYPCPGTEPPPPGRMEADLMDVLLAHLRHHRLPNVPNPPGR